MSIKDYNLALSITDSTTNEVISVIPYNYDNIKYDYFMRLDFEELQILKSIRECLLNRHDVSINFGYKKTM